jgi:hypothetical protein
MGQMTLPSSSLFRFIAFANQMLAMKDPIKALTLPIFHQA